METLLGTVIPLLPFFLPAVAAALAIFRMWLLAAFTAFAAVIISPAYATVSAGWSEAYSSMKSATISVLNGRWLDLWTESRTVVICVLVATFALLWDAINRKFSKIATPFYAITVAGVCTLAVVFVQTVYRVPFDGTTVSEIVRRPWLPIEKIDAKPAETYVGYIVATEGGWHTVLKDSDRTILYIRRGDISSRQVCRAGPPPLMVPPPLYQLGTRNPPDLYPQCPMVK